MGSNWLILGIIILMLIIVIVVFYFVVYKKDNEKDLLEKAENKALSDEAKELEKGFKN